ncbi:Trafficking protein particle complex subunit [Fasciolopsis buskii]|uniref:Trafficking protein particle complex subunit n=1 Tax=Fasciolopsis buskii TaxID=27845 RepID=A0A8E0RKM0_9TREM|nr:Trafficking protein particle complex subunit [Fasciolopsis buski]
MVGRYYFVIVGHNDEALFEFDYCALGKTNEKAEEYRYLNQYVAHAALDVIDDQMWLTTNTFLKTVDKFNEWIVSAFVTPGKLRFVLLHDEQNENRIRNFFQDVYEAYVKLALNPFFDRQQPICSSSFTKKVERLASKQFG